MDIKNQLVKLMKQLKETTDPIQVEALEDQILRLADMDESLNDTSLEDTSLEDNNYNYTVPDITNQNDNAEELDERELKRKQRVEAQLLKNADYIEKTTLENKEEELLRDSMMRDALHFDSEYANKKNRVIRKKR
jgi:hypothetical protein